MRPIYLISKTPYPGVIHIPILSITFLTPSIDFSEYEGIIVTSKQGISALQNYTPEWERLQCIAVSEPTARFAKESGAIHVETAEGYGESIPKVLSAKQRNGKWLYLRPEVVASSWVEHARLKGFRIDEAVVYATHCNENAFMDTIEPDGVLIFTSPSSIRCFMEKYTFQPTHSVIVIGKTTQSALPESIESYVSPDTSVASAVKSACKIVQESKNSSPF
ncbi:uroporphyrinogen-III synthase [Sulfuricurvum sp.]|uniref:uroporphyrinogen-III synthase n=1 Tax=Sulfuricurvum sp. TaxID=2025608 RepID=UPI0026326C0B|nr:uroporphyrinogen-III synthase [Sulfuricurvum sp.]MDD4884490.1 uroporphyrinogen-III synthase [Sulfuricurvum sp.]